MNVREQTKINKKRTDRTLTITPATQPPRIPINFLSLFSRFARPDVSSITVVHVAWGRSHSRSSISLLAEVVILFGIFFSSKGCSKAHPPRPHPLNAKPAFCLRIPGLSLWALDQCSSSLTNLIFILLKAQ